MLEVKDLKVEVFGKKILKGMDLVIEDGQTQVLFGPNGAGKTTLLMAIMGFPGYEIKSGEIIFGGKDITKLSLDERARLGIGMSFQRPPTIKGLKTAKMIELAGADPSHIPEIAERTNLGYLLGRDINDGFSGGEIKRSEIAQLMAQEPSLILLDEPESGVDLENISLLGEGINHLLHKELKRQRVNSALIITHTGHILDYVEADVGNLLLDGRIACSGNPREMLAHIKENGYEECAVCPKC
ncbi:MAG: ABC transporter ATP-binding protein [Actinomycetota bacterium]|nr:ABC transporter ATP-binding protein [Actinomycetota bacterium]